VRIELADVALIDRTLRRKRRRRRGTTGVDLRGLLADILVWANRFVPSQAGSILLDDPASKMGGEAQGTLYFVACFGRRAKKLVGTSIPDDSGIVGETYRIGRPYFCEDVRRDDRFLALPDKRALRECRSLIAVPIHIDDAIVGVIELINRKGQPNFDRKDLELLEVFAGYTATLVRNALDGRRFERMAQQDSLTGLFNYQHLHAQLVREIRKTLRRKDGDLSQIFFDLDHLKQVNDTHGHLVGSRLIQEVADIIRLVFEGTGALMARYGGDEYVIVLPELHLDEATAYAEVLRDRIARNVFLSRRAPGGVPPLRLKGLVTCSIGVASLRQNVIHRKDPKKMAEALTKAADKAMYRAKELGKNRVVRAEGKGG